MSRFVRLSASSDGTPIHVRSDDIRAIYLSDVKRPLGITGPDADPILTVVYTAGSTFYVRESIADVLGRIEEAEES